MNVVEGN